MVGNSSAALPRSRSPLLKKKLAPRTPLLANDCATVRDMVDFPVPAIPFSQNMHSPGLDGRNGGLNRSQAGLLPVLH